MTQRFKVTQMSRETISSKLIIAGIQPMPVAHDLVRFNQRMTCKYLGHANESSNKIYFGETEAFGNQVTEAPAKVGANVLNW